MMMKVWKVPVLDCPVCVAPTLVPREGSVRSRKFSSASGLEWAVFPRNVWYSGRAERQPAKALRIQPLCKQLDKARQDLRDRKEAFRRPACGTNGAACDFGDAYSLLPPPAVRLSTRERSNSGGVPAAASGQLNNEFRSARQRGDDVTRPKQLKKRGPRSRGRPPKSESPNINSTTEIRVTPVANDVVSKEGGVKLAQLPPPDGAGKKVSVDSSEDEPGGGEGGGGGGGEGERTAEMGEKLAGSSVRLKEPAWIEAVMPPQTQEGLLVNVEGLGLRDAMSADAVYNKELSWLAFNWRVLYQALDQRTPLFERLRFLAITCRNMDEFFSKRVGALKRQEAAGLENLIKDQSEQVWTPQQQLKIVVKEVQKMVDVQVTVLLKELLPAIRKNGISLLEYDQLKESQRLELRKYFTAALEPILTPLAVDPGHPFPFIGNMSLSIAVVLRYPFDDDIQFAIVNVPPGIDRWKSMGTQTDDFKLRNTFVSIEQIIVNNLDMLFGGMEILSAHVFRVTRNADVTRNEEEAEDLLEMITDEMRERKFAPFVRLEVDCQMPGDVVNRLAIELGLKDDDVYHICGPLGVGELDSLPVRLPIGSSLLFPPWSSLTHPRLAAGGDIFEVIRKGDILVQHPYHSFATSTQHFVEAAARDPKVVAIKATLYRTNQDSPVIAALIQAAEAGKQVAVLVELKARFDEARNVGFAHMLENAGCNVAYGLVGLKTHCKSTMVVRKEDDGLRTYVHIGTGNYNPRTASVYTDFGLLSCKPALGMDVADLFKYLTGYHRQLAYRKLLVAPGTMRPQFVRLIDREISNAHAGLPASLVIKCNGLDDTVMVEKLYEASMAGVRVDCIVRGMCRLRPKVPGLSDNIRVISIIGRFLEHHRIFRFENGGNPEYYIGSSDWMSRNLMRRVEVVTPVEDESLKKEVQEIIDGMLSDRRQAWELRSDGSYELLGVGPNQRPPPVTKAGGRKEGRSQASLAARAETEGIQQALMERVADQCKKAKRFNLKKKDGSVHKMRSI